MSSNQDHPVDGGLEPSNGSSDNPPSQSTLTNLINETRQIDWPPRTYQQLVHMLTGRGVRLFRPSRPPTALTPWQTDEECPICLEIFTDKIFFEPCGHICDFGCYQRWLETQLEPTFGRIPDHELWIITPRLITCPLCRQEAQISGPNNDFMIPAQAIYLSTLMRFEDRVFRNDAPTTRILFRSLQSSMVGFGWRLYFSFYDYITAGYWTIRVQDLIARDRLREFQPVRGFEGEVQTGLRMATVGELLSYRRFVELLVQRNIRFDRMLNFAGLYDGLEGPFAPDDHVTAEQMFDHMREVFVLLEEEATRVAAGDATGGIQQIQVTVTPNIEVEESSTAGATES